MDPKNEALINAQIAKLPDDIKRVIVSSEYKTKLADIVKRQRLLIDQAGQLEMEVTFVLIGLERLPNFVSNIKKTLGLSDIKASEVAIDIDENIFKPIRASIRKIDPYESVVEAVPTPVIANPFLKEPNEPIQAEEALLDREQVLREIENPALSSNTPIVAKPVSDNIDLEKIVTEVKVPVKTPLASPVTNKLEDSSLKIEVKSEVPGSIFSKPYEPSVASPTIQPKDIFLSKFSETTSQDREVTEIKEERKLPPVSPTKNRPTDGADRYREPII